MTLRRLAFVVSSRSNLFMAELLDGFARSVRDDLGLDAEVVADGFPPLEDGLAYVVVPHELFGTLPEERWPDDAQLARTVALGTEQPGTPWFEHGYRHARRCGAVADLSPVGAAEQRFRGLACEHVQVGYLPAWDQWGGDPDAERPVDVLFMGSLNRRRDVLLATYAPTLWPHASDLVVTTHAPKTAPGPDFLTGAAKHGRMAAARVLLSPGRQEAPYFEWVRAVEAIANGAVFVCDHAAGAGPLEPGVHYVSGAAESLALLADGLLREPERLAEIRAAARTLLVDELPMRRGAERLVELAEALVRAPAASVAARGLEPDPPPPPAPPAEEAPIDPVAEALKRTTLEAIDLRRRVATLELELAGTPARDEPRLLHETPAWAGTDARVTVCIPCYRYADEVGDAIASVAAQEGPEVALLVLDDASGDGSVDAVRAALEARPWLPARLLGRDVNAGLARARNALAEHATTEYVLMLDADNELLPPAIARLTAALDADPEATFAYPALQVHRDGAPDGLLSYRAWNPALLAERNIVDALALLRRARLLEVGGYTDDPRMYGWEDYDLWARVAEHGGHGVHVPQILGRYRRGSSSMLSITDIDTSVMRRVLQTRYPRTMTTFKSS